MTTSHAEVLEVVDFDFDVVRDAWVGDGEASRSQVRVIWKVSVRRTITLS